MVGLARVVPSAGPGIVSGMFAATNAAHHWQLRRIPLSDRIQALPSVLLRCRYNALVSTLAGEVAVSVIIPA